MAALIAMPFVLQAACSTVNTERVVCGSHGAAFTADRFASGSHGAAFTAERVVFRSHGAALIADRFLWQKYGIETKKAPNMNAHAEAFLKGAQL